MFKKEGERQTDRQTEKQTDRQTDRERTQYFPCTPAGSVRGNAEKPQVVLICAYACVYGACLLHVCVLEGRCLCVSECVYVCGSM